MADRLRAEIVAQKRLELRLGVTTNLNEVNLWKTMPIVTLK